MIQFTEPEWKRLRTDFEARAGEYYSLKLSIFYVIRGRVEPDVKFSKRNHAISLWQHFGHLAGDASIESIGNLEPTQFGVAGALVTAFAVIIGKKTDLFRRMAERAGSLIPDEVCQRFSLEVASKFVDPNAKGKPLCVCNANPLAKWLSLVLVTIATLQPERFRNSTLALDPFAASLVAIDYVISQISDEMRANEYKGLIPVDMQQLAHEVRSFAILLNCANQDLPDEPSTTLMRRVQEQVLRIRTLLPEPLVLASCDLLARRTLQQVAESMEAMQSRLEQASPPFQVSDLGLIYALAAELDRHADADARRKSVAPPLTVYQRQQLDLKYGASEYMRRLSSGEPDNAVERIDAGIMEALRRFPDTRTWTVGDWTALFFCSDAVVRETAAWRSLDAAATLSSERKDSPAMKSKTAHSAHPKVFVSYSWDSAPHKSWVKQFATRLRKDGIDVMLDQWHVVPGDQLPRFMETAIRENSYVVVVCTPNYKLKSDERRGGVGYEGDIMTAEVLTDRNDQKFIAVLRSGLWGAVMPSWLKGKYSIDLTGDPYSDEEYSDLLVTLHNRREQPPPIGAMPHFGPIRQDAREAVKTGSVSDGSFEPIRIEGVLVDEAGRPANDGTPGCALYSIPFKLSRVPSADWASLFVQIWDHPPKYTSRHRPGIARVQGDRIVLTRTTIEEVKDVHRDTLKLVVDLVNKQALEKQQAQQAAEEDQRRREQQHVDNVRKVADEIQFD